MVILVGPTLHHRGRTLLMGTHLLQAIPIPRQGILLARFLLLRALTPPPVTHQLVILVHLLPMAQVSLLVILPI